MNFAEFTEIFCEKDKLLSYLLSLVLEVSVLPQHQEDTGNSEDL